MQSRWSLRVVALSAFLALGAHGSAAMEPLPSRFALSLGYHYSSGTYGGASTTEIAYIPLTAKAEVGRWSVQAAVPYLRISGPAGVAEGPSGPIQTKSGQSVLCATAWK